MKRLSVIVPGYNTPDLLWLRCIRSVRAALGKLNDLAEIICIDDGSIHRPNIETINSVVGPLTSDLGPKIKWLFLDKNVGLSSARNAGIEAANGEYVTFVDSDDEVNTEAFVRCIEKLCNTKDDICIYGVDVIWQLDGIRKHDIPEEADCGAMEAKTFEQLYYGCLFNYACNKVYRRSFLDKHNLRFNPDGMPCEDIIFNLNCLIAGAKWCSVAYEGYVYYRSGTTQTSNYLASYAKGTKMAADTWAKYCEMDPEADKRFRSFAEMSDEQLLFKTWDNMWWRKSPYSLYGRYVWLNQHADKMRVSNVPLEFLKKLLYYTLRKWLYIKPIRIWHLKRVFPNIEKIESSTVRLGSSPSKSLIRQDL